MKVWSDRWSGSEISTSAIHTTSSWTHPHGPTRRVLPQPMSLRSLVVHNHPSADKALTDEVPLQSCLPYSSLHLDCAWARPTWSIQPALSFTTLSPCSPQHGRIVAAQLRGSSSMNLRPLVVHSPLNADKALTREARLRSCLPYLTHLSPVHLPLASSVVSPLAARVECR